MNTPQKIDELLARYWEGETNIAEERALKRYFEGLDIAPKHLPFAPLFAALGLAQRVQGPDPRPMPAPLRVSFFRNRRLMAAASVAALIAAVSIFQWSRQPDTDVGVPVASLAPSPTPPPSPAPQSPSTHRDTLALQPAAPPRAKRKKARPLNEPVSERSALATLSQEDAEAEQAYLELKAALELIAQKLNKGKAPVAEALQNTEVLGPFFSQMNDDN